MKRSTTEDTKDTEVETRFSHDACQDYSSVSSVSSVVESLAPEIPSDLLCGQRPGSPIEPRPGMRPRATDIQVADRRGVAGETEQRARDEQLIERELAVEDVTARQAVSTLEIERR